MNERFDRAWTRAASSGDGVLVWHCLEALYAHPPRAYHTIHHAHDCVRALDRLGTLRDPLAAELALWFHDCVHVPHRRDNEERSAAIAHTFLRADGAAPELGSHVTHLIMATKHAGETLDPADDAAAVADADLSILGSDAAVYAKYAWAIRAEYTHLSDDDFRAGRRDFLRKMVARPAIFHTQAGKGMWEEAARANMAAEIAKLEAAGERL